jgi:lipoate-protein ligase A
MRHEEKITNGKLVCIEAQAEGGKVVSVRISGDFFLHPEEAIEDLERSLSGLSLPAEEDAIASLIRDSLQKSGARLIGATAEDLARVFSKAVSG